MRSQEQLWLQCPLSSWSSSASGKVIRQAGWRAMALKRLLLYRIQHNEGAGNKRACHHPHMHGHVQLAGDGYGKIINLSQQKLQLYVQGHGYGRTRTQQQLQVFLPAQGHSYGIVQVHAQSGGNGYDKTAAHQANLQTHSYGETLAEQQQHMETRAPQHLKMFVQAQCHGYKETIANQKGHAHVQVRGQQYAKMHAQQQQQTGYVRDETLAEPVAHRPLPKRLLPITVTRRSFSTNSRPMYFQKSIPIADTIQLTDLEFKIFNTLKAFLLHDDLRTQLRVAGGWVRDKLLGRQCGDIDITLDDMLGRTFCRKLSNYCRMVGIQTTGFGVIKSNPMQAKHLEVARMDILGVTIDFVNLRSDDYSESSFLPSNMQDFGTITEDAFRRDFTINSLFYNITTERVEDPTGKGLYDLTSGIIATPLHPKITFTDDPLRVLRALRFVAVLGYDLHPDAKVAIDADIKLAFFSKISRQRVGGEVEKILSCIDPLKAVELLVETQLFPIIFNPPAKLDIILPEGIERACLCALDAVIDIVKHFGSSKLQVEERKSLYLAAFLSPLRAFLYEHNGKLISISTPIIKESLKLRSIDAAMVATLHKTAGSFTSIRKLVLKLDTIDQGNGEQFITDLESQISYSHAKHQIGMLLEEMRGLWRSSLLLGAIFEEEESMFSLPHDKKKAEFIRRSHLCIFVEEALVRLGLEKMNGPIPFVDRRRLVQAWSTGI